MKNSTKLRWFKRVPHVRTVKMNWQHRSDIELTRVPDAIRELAENVYRIAKDSLPVHHEIDAEIEQHAGDYPPKKLGAK